MSEQDPVEPPAYGPPPPSYRPPPPPHGAGTPPNGANTPPHGFSGYGAPVPLDDAQTRQWAGLAHLGGIVYLLPSLIIWLVYRERSAFVAQEAKKALNFQVTVAIANAALFVLAITSVPFTDGMRLAVWVVSLIFSIQGYQAVQRGQAYRYPVTLELIR